MKYDFLIVGAGFAGSVCAQQLAEAGKTVLVVASGSNIPFARFAEIVKDAKGLQG